MEIEAPCRRAPGAPEVMTPTGPDLRCRGSDEVCLSLLHRWTEQRGLRVDCGSYVQALALQLDPVDRVSKQTARKLVSPLQNVSQTQGRT